MVAVLDPRFNERLALDQSPPAFLMIQRIAHRLAVGAGRGQVHLGDDVRENPADRDTEGDDGLDRLRTGLVQECHLNPGGIGISAVRHGQDTSSASSSLDGPGYWTTHREFSELPATYVPGYPSSPRAETGYTRQLVRHTHNVLEILVTAVRIARVR